MEHGELRVMCVKWLGKRHGAWSVERHVCEVAWEKARSTVS